MKKTSIVVAILISAALAACGGKNKKTNTTAGSGDMGSGSAMGSGSGDMGSGSAAGSGSAM